MALMLARSLLGAGLSSCPLRSEPSEGLKEWEWEGT